MIRRYEKTDLIGVVQLLERNKHKTVHADEYCCARDLSEQLENLMDLDNAIVLVSQNSKGTITGIMVAVVWHQIWNKAYIIARDLLFVSEGRGRDMLRYYTNWAKSKGATKIMTHCSSGNTRTEQFYSSLGAKRLGSLWEI